jgi:hypothetical protein
MDASLAASHVTAVTDDRLAVRQSDPPNGSRGSDSAMAEARKVLAAAGRWTWLGPAVLIAGLPGPAAAEPATVLAYEVGDQVGNTNSNANFAEAKLDVDLPRDALIFVNASGGASYSGPLTGAGIRVSIRYGTKAIVTEDDSFEGQSLNMSYRASASHVCLLPQGRKATFTAWTERLGPVGAGGGNTGTTVRLELVAIAADLPGPPRRTCGGAF